MRSTGADPLRVRVRRRLGGLAVEYGLRSLSRLGKLHPRSKPERHGVEVIRNASYAPTGRREHLLDVYRPVDPDGPAPALLYLHGGGFRILSKDTHWMMGLAFARRGYVVFNANYRLAPAHPFPAAVEDAGRALCWVVDNAARWGADPSRVVLAGESAGGNLVTSLTVACCFEREESWAREVHALSVVPRVVIPFCGMLEVSNGDRYLERTDLPLWVRDRVRDVCAGYLGGAEEGPHLELANPLTVLEGAAEPVRPLPAFHASVGDRDPIADDTRRLEIALARRGVPHRVTYHPGEPHAFQALLFRAAARRAWRECYDFLDEHDPRR